jgi:selenocysteine lyase/cysteine desulfurase
MGEKNEMSEEFIYLDNAATTWPKPEQVYIAVDKTMTAWGRCYCCSGA